MKYKTKVALGLAGIVTALSLAVTGAVWTSNLPTPSREQIIQFEQARKDYLSSKGYDLSKSLYPRLSEDESNQIRELQRKYGVYQMQLK